MKPNNDIFVKIHDLELVTKDKLSIDLEAVVLDGNRIVPHHPVAFTMNGKTHNHATMENGRIRTQLVFPCQTGKVNLLETLSGPNSLSPVSTTIDILPPGSAVKTPTAAPFNADDILFGRRPIKRGETLTLEKGYYEVTGDIHIHRGGKLLIEAGSTLEFEETAGIVCEGVLEAIGTQDRKITFAPLRTHWRNILIYGRHTANTRLTYCLIQQGTGRSLQKNQHRNIYEPQTVEDKTLPRNGGGLQVLYTKSAEIFLQDLVLRDNSVLNGHGGGLYLLESAPLLHRCRFYRNEAQLGGGVYIAGDASHDVILNDLEVEANNAVEDGGGIYLEEVSPLFKDSRIIENRARFGAALFHLRLPPEDLHLEGCTIIDNVSSSVPEDHEGVAGS